MTFTSCQRAVSPQQADLGRQRAGGLIIGGDYQGLGIARSLGRHGIPVCVIDDETSIARASRFVQHVFRVRDLGAEASFLDALASARARLGPSRWVLFPTREEHVAAIAANREALVRDFRVPTPASSVIRRGWDKRETYRLASQLSIAIPRTWFPRTEADLAAIDTSYPLVVKPAIKEHFIYATGAKAWRAGDRAQLASRFRRAAQIVRDGEIIVQELIPGGGQEQYAYCAFFRDGQALASMTVRRRRQHPSDFGRASTYVETIALPELAEPSIRFLRSIGYYGLVELEYKRDPRDAAFKLLDVNVRTWGYHTIGRPAGVDFPYLLYRDQVGAQVHECHACPGVRWIRLATDLPNAVRDIRAGALRPRDYLRSLRHVDTEAVFSVRDPLPASTRSHCFPTSPSSADFSLRTEEPVFEASHPLAFFDYFRVPYQVRPPRHPHGTGNAIVHRLSAAGHADRPVRSLLWLRAAARSADIPLTCRLGRYQLRDCNFFGHVALDAGIPAALRDLGREWRQAEPILAADGRRVASTWRDSDGSVFLPFDPGEVMEQFWSESYRDAGRSHLAARGRAAVLRAYYLTRPALPRPVQLGFRRLFSQVQARSSFPRWPVEDSLHNLYAWLFALVAEVAGRPVPFLGLWPGGRSWAFVLTHDVETDAGYHDMELLRGTERELGYRSSWNFVGARYRVDDEIVRALHDEGCEVGVHGLRHDGRDLGSRRLMEKRLPAMREFADRWRAVGFRSPSTQREWSLMPRLGFEYDSSYSDTDPYEPQPGGCCTYLPYFNQTLVELPMTLPQDHTVFCILQNPDPDVWLRKAQLLRDRHGMVLLLTHPDYARDQRVADGYRKLLDMFHGDNTAWHALPREVAAWWRDRDASTISHGGGNWTITGPASASGRVQFAGGCCGR